MDQVVAAPEIVETVGDVGRPKCPFSQVTDTRHIPGKQGLLSGLANLAGWMRQGHDYVRASAEKNGGVFRSQFANKKLVMVTDPALASGVLRNRDKTWSTALGWLEYFGGICDGPMDSPVALDFGPHRDVRKLLQPAFMADALESYVDMAAPIFENAIEEWIEAGHVELKPAVRELFAQVSAKVFMGVDDPAEAKRLDRWMTDFWGGMLALSKNEWLSPTWRRARKAYQNLFAHFRGQVDARRENGGEDLFSRLCRTNESVDWLDDDALVRMFLALMSAAFDTTSAAVTSMAYVLATNESWQTELRNEARTVTLGRACYRDVKQLDRAELVWKETLRFYPVAASVPRRALRDTELGGYAIPAGTLIGAVMTAAHRDPARWTDPDTFDPERFSPERNEGKKSGAYMPFGSGAHSCIGAQLASLEAKAFWHAFLSRASFRLAKPYEAHHELKPLGMVSGRVELYVDAVAVRPLPPVRLGVDAELPHAADQTCPWQGEEPSGLRDSAAAGM